MREIKFRAYSHSMQRMLPVELLDSGFDGSPDDPIAVSEGMMLAQGDFELMQYTGLHDSNGKKIYEGDIVRTIEGKIQRVEFIAGYVDDADDLGIAQYRTVTAENESYYLSRTDEVVGNIYENPELLEARDDD